MGSVSYNLNIWPNILFPKLSPSPSPTFETNEAQLDSHSLLCNSERQHPNFIFQFQNNSDFGAHWRVLDHSPSLFNSAERLNSSQQVLAIENAVSLPPPPLSLRRLALREVTKACVRAGAIDFGMKTLWKHNLFGLTPDIGSAHHLLSYAKQHNDVKLMVKVLRLMKKNDLPFQPGTVDIVLSICYSTDRWDLMTKHAKRFVKSGVNLRQTSFDLLMEFAARKADVESLWKIEKWRSEAMKKHSLSTGFSCAKGFLLEHKPESAAAIIQVLYQILPEARRPTVMVELQKLVSEWPLEVIKQQKEDGKAFASALQNDISALINALPSLGVEANVSMQDLTGKEAVLS
ncbi:UNVERIFIED_CONTAM: hypothetical protein Sangu_1968500 [Sesamum angustifolium]|uniref:Uncharacterized protein n=1 Tax=Sesamum angustifolium TaxID=2727405 RepID=A0AAW2LVX4_9LAMI